MKIAVFVSGGGTNLQAIIDNTKTGILKDVEISLVVSSSRTAYALERAANNGIATAVFPRKEFDSVEEWDEKVLEAVENRIINIHPALIPSFCGAGMYGIRPHKAALAKGVKVSGATVHFVNENYDDGPILLQKAVDVLPDDTPESLQKRIMQECEWKILPQAIRLIADGKVIIENNICYVR